jgi:S-adenosylmethionine synthetase
MSELKNFYFTSESVSEGHPDKICDQVSDAVLDAVLAKDPNARVACECYATTGMIVVGGEITTNVYIDIPDLVRNVIKEIGYTRAEYKFDSESVAVINVINKQSPHIAMGVDTGGAGDQGMMFGYAINETPELMPATIMYAHRLVQELARIRKEGKIMTYLAPDAKSQVTIEYTPEKKIKRIDAVVLSTQHHANVERDQIEKDLKEHLFPLVLPKELIDENTKFYVNPTGRFEIGGPHGDTGLTGRKIIVDTYGGKAPHGGGAFSGKDATKVDRSAAYMGRYLAKNVVASGIASECTIQLSYAIGVAEPVSVFVDTHGTSKVNAQDISDYIQKHINLTPKGIIERFNLRRPIYQITAAYGHFGRATDSGYFPWEQTDIADSIKRHFA